jgi:antitoxin component YwqK of YwqJK toxin-antitoxin module
MRLSFYLLTVLVFFIHLQLYGQTALVKEYVDVNFAPVKKEEASYYRVASKDKDSTLIGLAAYYYFNGSTDTKKLYARGEYEKNSKAGKWEWWYENGHSKEVGYFESESTLETDASGVNYIIESFWDSTGVQLVKDGSGEVKYFSNGIIQRIGFYLNGIKMVNGRGILIMVSPLIKRLTNKVCSYKESAMIILESLIFMIC